MRFQEEERHLAWESIRKLLDATREQPVLSSDEILNMGAYFARDSQKMVTVPLALIKQYDEELRYFSEMCVDGFGDHATYVRLHAKLEEYLPEKDGEG